MWMELFLLNPNEDYLKELSSLFSFELKLTEKNKQKQVVKQESFELVLDLVS